MNCPSCGNSYDINENFCKNCGFSFQSAASSEIRVNKSVFAPQTLEYGNFWKRLVAHILDMLLIFFPAGIIVGMAAPFILTSVAEDRGNIILFTVIVQFALFFIAWLYYALMESSSKQATLGKMALGLKVTDIDGNRLSFRRASGRIIIKYLFFFLQSLEQTIGGLAILICFGMAGFTQKRQAFHDIVAKTLVLKK